LRAVEPRSESRSSKSRLEIATLCVPMPTPARSIAEASPTPSNSATGALAGKSASSRAPDITAPSVMIHAVVALP
jgi:hypothetical protein